MPELGLVVLYVENPAASAAWYARLLGQDPTEASPTFAMFKLPSGLALGLWSRSAVEPPAPVAGSSTELALTVNDVDRVHADWKARGFAIAQLPTDMDFGRTFVALDPDGHRLRVFAPAPG